MLVLFLSSLPLRAEPTDDAPVETVPQAEASPQLLKWHTTLAAGLAEAKERKTGVLVKVGADWCVWCHKLDREITQPTVQAELSKWVLVRLDADDNPDEVRQLNIGPIPALRILDTSGHTVRSHEGFLPAAQFVAWLLDRGLSPNVIPDLDLLPELLDAPSLRKLVQFLGHRDAKVREAATQRLTPHRDQAGHQVVQQFTQGSLSLRLAALELLASWEAPTQNLDPWQPETLTLERLAQLQKWAEPYRMAEPEADRPPPPAIPESSPLDI